MARARGCLVVLAFGTAVLVLVAGLAAWGWATGALQVNHPATTRFPVRGLDVSHYQGAIDWRRVRAEGYSFVYVKATEGGDYTDPRYVELAAGARSAGLRVGAYHYFTFCRDGAEQARHAVDVVGPSRQPADLPLVADLEFGGNCSRNLSQADLDRQFSAFEAVVRAAFGRSPVLYVSQDFRHRYVDGAQQRGSPLAGHRLWIRSIIGGPGGGCAQWAFWQFADRGRVDGVDGPVDLDVYCGDRAALEREFG